MNPTEYAILAYCITFVLLAGYAMLLWRESRLLRRREAQARASQRSSEGQGGRHAESSNA